MARRGNAASARSGQRNYRIRVAGQLNREWSDRLQGMEVTTYGSESGAVSSELSGLLPDQAALMGVLQHLYSCGVTIMGMECVGAARRTVDAGSARPRANPALDKESRKIMKRRT